MKVKRVRRDETGKVVETQVFDDTSDPKGLVCPRCACRDFRVVYTRRVVGAQIERRRQCRHCGHRITTHEAMSF